MFCGEISGGKKTFKWYLKSEHTDRRTDVQTDRRTFRLIKSIDQEGRRFEKLGYKMRWKTCAENLVDKLCEKKLMEKLVEKLGAKLCGKIVWKNWVENLLNLGEQIDWKAILKNCVE